MLGVQQSSERSLTLEKMSIYDVLDYLNFHHSDVQFCIEKPNLSRIIKKNAEEYLTKNLLSYHQYFKLTGPSSKKFQKHD